MKKVNQPVCAWEYSFKIYNFKTFSFIFPKQKKKKNQKKPKTKQKKPFCNWL